MVMKHLHRAALPALFLLSACGGSGTTLSESATADAAREVTISGTVTAPGTKGALLVFALAGGEGEVATREALSVAAIDADGTFAFAMPPAESVTLAFLADGANDGGIDGGDPVAVLSGPALANLRGGETVVAGEVSLDFRAGKATAARLEVQRGGVAAESTRTPTAVPAA